MGKFGKDHLAAPKKNLRRRTMFDDLRAKRKPFNHIKQITDGCAKTIVKTGRPKRTISDEDKLDISINLLTKFNECKVDENGMPLFVGSKYYEAAPLSPLGTDDWFYDA